MSRRSSAPRRTLRAFRDDGDGHQKRVCLRTLVIVLVLSGLVAQLPIAYARPADAGWLAGLYEDADYDEVMQLTPIMRLVTRTALCGH